MRKQVKQTGLLLMVMAAGTLAAAGSVKAEEGGGRADRIRSKGIINYADDSVVIDSGDLILLADEIDILEDTYKSTTKDALKKIGTYIKPDGSVTHNVPSDQLAAPSFAQLASAIENSQSSSSAINDLSGEIYYKSGHGSLQKESEGGSGEPISLAPATADDLSAGTVAYVDGTLLLGTGADNCTYYDQGFTGGYAQGFADGYAQKMDGMEIEYTYHQHTNDCYTDCREVNSTKDFPSWKYYYCMCTNCEAYDYHLCNYGFTQIYSCGAYVLQPVGMQCVQCGEEFYYPDTVHNPHKFFGCGKDDSTIESAKIMFH